MNLVALDVLNLFPSIQCDAQIVLFLASGSLFILIPEPFAAPGIPPFTMPELIVCVHFQGWPWNQPSLLDMTEATSQASGSSL